VILKEISLDEAVKIAENRKTSHSDKKESIITVPLKTVTVPLKTVTVQNETVTVLDSMGEKNNGFIPVSDSVSVSVSVSDKENNNNKAKNKNVVVVDGLKLPENENWRNLISQGYKIKPELIPAKLDEFLDHLDRKMVVYDSKQDFVNHFTNWLPKIQKAIPATGNMINFNGMIKGVL
jgi:hypothetical protein